MPVHDWSRVQAGTFHDFHSAWITHLKEALNGGLLPEGYYALAEQHAGSRIADVLTLHIPEPFSAPVDSAGHGGVVLLDAPPRVDRKLVASPASTYRTLRRTLTVRQTSGHRIVALVEIVSPGNKDRLSSVIELSEKVDWALRHGVHVLLIDLFAPGKHDPRGMHGAIWAFFDEEEFDVPRDRPVTLSSYMSSTLPEAHIVHLAFGSSLPEMPLFLQYRAYINVPLESTYEAAFRGMPSIYREVLEGRRRTS
jgi:hypothetical protein